MPDPVTTIGLGAIAAYLGKDGLEKLLGPTADYLGEGLRDFAQKRTEAIGRIFLSATDKLGDKMESPGEVPPKVLKVIVNEGSYASDTLEVEYFGGILASARTESGRDDRSARLAKIVDSLSTYQLRTHYLIYSTIRHLFAGRNIAFDREGRPKMQIFIPYSDYYSAMAFDKDETSRIMVLLRHVFFGLHADSLIDGLWKFGQKEHLLAQWPNVPSGGIVCAPSAPGAELYLAAHGCANQDLDYIFSPALGNGVPELPKPFPNALATQA